ncbi:cytochrome-c oxidase, cbb3-type subunit III [Niveispirillum sp. SYP-B3756]|uniref:cytochrome-c oxidase, cbb3-type subunit III n=1 Tax=Niveispirillum sp. SYP-B3756 TaxID=2662178 RepID=UPI001290DB13|nr:cytochrome-c oxidase, cbb3-type subunit III [Niveispirillum sp. SYP-B3756]MQP68629.1 cytochrome-c oxidase, cbb3-type subunit III [Niveispirillum sp. SYP-B3756]
MSGGAERDPISGYMTTGHEWNGIKELNTPVPRAVWFFLITTVLFAVVWWVLMPAWPLGNTYTKGLLGIDQRQVVQHDLRRAAERMPPWRGAVLRLDYASIQADPALMGQVRRHGAVLFGDNCAACHGLGGRGGPGFPALASGSWLWGGAPEVLAETIRVGINSDHPETRVSQMPAFGRDQMLSRPEILAVLGHVRSLSGGNPGSELGRDLFAANCAACHGEDAHGAVELGAPNLTDPTWIYGGDEETIFKTIFFGRQGHMPRWDQRLSELDRKVLALYVADLAAGGTDGTH